MPDLLKGDRIYPILGIGLFLLLSSLLVVSDLRANAATFVLIITSATLLLFGLFRLTRGSGTAPSRTTIIVGAILLRVLLLPLTPSLSDDAWRYLWDGRLVLNGISPYHHFPNDSSLAGFHDELYRLQGYPETNTIYPPGAQLLFAASIAIAAPLGDDPLIGYYVWKIILVAIELGAILLLLKLLDRHRLDRGWALLYAWHPLVLVEIAGQGHTDGLWVAALGLAFWGYDRMRQGDGLGAVGLGVVTRIFPALIAPVWFRFIEPGRRVKALLWGVPVLLLLIPLLDPVAFDTYTRVAARFTNYYEFNGGFYYAVKRLLDELRVMPSNTIAGLITTGVLIVGVAMITLRPIRRRTFESLLLRVLGIITLQIALTAKVHVWYVVAPLFLLPLERSRRFAPGWLWMSLVAPMTYLYYAVVPNSEPLWLLWAEWAGLGLLLIFGFITRREPSTVESESAATASGFNA